MQDHDFDEALYVALNGDVAHAFDAGTLRDPAGHWREAGQAEARAGGRPALAEAAVEPPAFDPAPAADGFAARFYLDMNADLRAAFGADEDAARRHWAEHGRIEGRIAAGDVSFARRPDPGLALARPFGVDLHLEVDESGAAAAAGRRLLRALRLARVPVGLRPFVARGGRVLLPADDVGRAAGFRAALLVGSPFTLRCLLRAHPPRHFDASYLIAALGDAPMAAHMPDFPTLAMLDEVWLGSARARDRLASVAPVPVRHVPMSAARLAGREEARSSLALAPGERIALLDASGRGQEALRAAAVRLLDRGVADRLLVRAADGGRVAEAERAMAGLPAHVRLDRREEGGSLLVAAADLLCVDGAPWIDVVDAAAAGRDLCGAEGEPVAAEAQVNRQATARAIDERLATLGLRTPLPAFARVMARPRASGLPVPPAHQSDRMRPDLPVLSLVMAERMESTEALASILAALEAHSYPFWELCAATTFPVPRRDPRVRLLARTEAATRAARLNEAARVATGWLVPVADAADACLLAASLPALADLLGDTAPVDVVVAQDAWPEAAEPIDRLMAGGPGGWPVAVAARAARRAGLFAAADGAALERGLLLRLIASGARLRTMPGLPLRPSRRPDEDEAYRVVLGRHLRARVGPLARATPGLVAAGARRRTLLHVRQATVVLAAGAPAPAGLPPWVTVVAGAPADWGRVATEAVLLVGEGVARAEPGAVVALLEWLAEDEVGAAGGRVEAPDGTLHEAGLHVDGHGRLVAPGRHLPADPAFVPAAFAVRNPPAAGAVVAVRRTVLLAASGLDAGLCEVGAAMEMLSADLCLRLARDQGLRTVFVPDAVFIRAPDGGAPGETPAGTDAATQADLQFASRWASEGAAAISPS